MGALPTLHVPSNNPPDQSVAECSGQLVPGGPDHPSMTETVVVPSPPLSAINQTPRPDAGLAYPAEAAQVRNASPPPADLQAPHMDIIMQQAHLETGFSRQAASLIAQPPKHRRL